jgi:hypothetical protein
MGLTTDLQNAQLWPIKAKGAVQRLNPLGDPQIEKYYHASLEQGRHLEREIGGAQHWLLQKKKDLMEKINMYTNMNNLAVDGQLGHTPRAIKYVADSIKILNDVNKFQQEIIGLITAITQNIGMLQMMEANMVGMVQQNLNSLANLLNSICNWGLPDLPAIPNMFSDTIWYWNGFNFIPLSAFALTAKSLKFDTDFAFNQCVIHIPNINIFRNYPTSLTTYSGLQYGTTAFVPPLGGLIPNTGTSYSDPNFISTMQNTTTTPYYLPPTEVASPVTGLAKPFNVNSSMLGAVPDPSTIISNYQMPSATYQANIISIVPTTRDQTIEPTDTDYSNPNLTVRDASLRKALVHYVTLEQVVASNFDPNLTSAWLFYMNSARNGRAGQWLANFQVDYTQFITPSVAYLASTPTPWNCVLPGAQVNNAPSAIPLISALTSVDSFAQGNILWRLSYLEASLLGYTRSQDWDSSASGDFISSFTGTDLDYKATAIDTATTTTVILGADTADYPTSCTFPSAIGNVLQEVIAVAAINIQNTPTYTTSRPQFKYVYDQFAQAKLVDRFTQFWREFNANLQALLLQDPYLLQFVVSYGASLDSAIDPLGDPTSYNQLKADAASRNRSWTPGNPLLPIPKAPVVSFSTNSTPNAGTSGWTGSSFDPNVFLQRPDIQQLPIGTQIAMLRTNLSYAATQQSGQDVINTIQNSIQQAQTLLQDFLNIGFKAEVNVASPEDVPVGLGLQVYFDQIDFDLTNNVTSPDTFTIQKAGNYALIVSLNWGMGVAGVRTGNIFLSKAGSPPTSLVIGTASTDGTQAGPTTIQMSINQYFDAGDVITVIATHSLTTVQTILAGSYISATLTDTTPPDNSVGIPSSSTSATRTFIAGTSLSPLTAVAVLPNSPPDGSVSAIDPTTVQTDGHGNPIYPIVTGVTLSSAITGGKVTVGTNFGGVYEYVGGSPPLAFTVGGLIYAGAGGLLTQDYSIIVNGNNSVSPPTPPCQWVVVVGRAISTNQFIYEPHIPNLMNLGTF